MRGLPYDAIGANRLPENRETLRKALSPEGIRSEYSSGMPNLDVIAPEGYTLDAALIARPGNMDIQLDLFLDYANNVKLYPAFHDYFRKCSRRCWQSGGSSIRISFPPAPRLSARQPNATVRWLDTGHFALETHVEEIANAMRGFLARSAG